MIPQSSEAKLDGMRPPAVQTKFHGHRVLEDLETKAIKAGQVYTEIQTKKGIVFKGKQLFSVMMSSFPPRLR